jgi:Protein of unknown function (DUF4435)
MSTAQEEIEQFLADLTITGKNTVVLVEDKEDMHFWERIFKEFAPHIKPDFPFSTKSGKDTLRKYTDFVNKNILICVDSDNDAYHTTKNSIWLSPRRKYIYQTYAHSRENHFIHPNNLNQIAKSLIQMDYDFDRDFKELSIAVYEWLVLWLYFTDENNTWIGSQIKSFGNEISWKKLESLLKEVLSTLNGAKSIEEACNITTFVKEKMLNHNEYILSILSENGFDSVIEDFNKFRAECPILPEDSLWFIQGHRAFDDIILPYFDKIIQLLSTQSAENAKSDEERNRWKKRSENKTSNRDVLTTQFTNCLTKSQKCRFFDQIQTDIENDFV